MAIDSLGANGTGEAGRGSPGASVPVNTEAAPIAVPAQRRGHEGEHREGVRQMFDRIAPTYDTVNRVLSVGIDGEWRKRALAQLRARDPRSVLDLCAGTLDVAAAVERTFPLARVVAADLSAEMLERGKHKAKRTERVTCDATDLPFADGTFDAVVCSFGIRNVADTARALQQVRRVLGPDGVFVTLEFFRPERTITRAFHSVYGRWVMPTVGGLLSKDKSAYAYLVGSMGAFLTVGEYEAQLRDAGFSMVRHEALTLGVATLVVAQKGPAEGREP